MNVSYPAQVKSKTNVLKRLRADHIEPCGLPNLQEGHWIKFSDKFAKLQEVIRSVGGECRLVQSPHEILADLSNYPEFRDAESIWSNTPIVASTVDLNAVDHPHDLESVDFTVYHSELAVAENGAAWVSDDRIRHRVIFFIAQHLVLIVKRSDIVNNLYEAYSRVSMSRPGFNCLISGPSKTADIEQSLVIGAHGCRSMQMYVLNDE